MVHTAIEQPHHGASTLPCRSLTNARHLRKSRQCVWSEPSSQSERGAARVSRSIWFQSDRRAIVVNSRGWKLGQTYSPEYRCQEPRTLPREPEFDTGAAALETARLDLLRVPQQRLSALQEVRRLRRIAIGGKIDRMMSDDGAPW